MSDRKELRRLIRGHMDADALRGLTMEDTSMIDTQGMGAWKECADELKFQKICVGLGISVTYRADTIKEMVLDVFTPDEPKGLLQDILPEVQSTPLESPNIIEEAWGDIRGEPANQIIYDDMFGIQHYRWSDDES